MVTIIKLVNTLVLLKLCKTQPASLKDLCLIIIDGCEIRQKSVTTLNIKTCL